MRARLSLFVALLFAPVLAGCATPAAVTTASSKEPPLEVLHGLAGLLDVAVEVEEGITLRGTVYLPGVPEGVQVPVVLDMGPYYGDLNPETSTYDEEMPPNRLYAHLLARGYAIALVSLRGTGLSDGCFAIGGPQEEADVAAVVEWLAAQPWSTGAVAMTGVSYDGTTPWEALVSGKAPSLKAIVPVAGISDHYRYSFYEGVPVGGGAAFNTYYQALVDVAYTSTPHLAQWAPTLASHACPEQAEVYLAPYETLLDGVHGPFWDAREMSARLADTTAAVFVVHGLKDFNVKADNAQHLWDDLPGPRRMLLGQWEHNIPWSNSYDHEQNWTQYNKTIHQFLDAYVKGDPDALAREQAAPPVLVQTSANVTRGFSAWPPAEAVMRAWLPGAEGALVERDAAEGELRMSSTPATQLAGSVGPPELDALRDELVFTSEPLAAPLLLVGNPRLELNLSVDRPEGMVEARLYHVHAGGERELISMGWQNLGTRTTRDEAEEVPTGEPMALVVQMLALAQQLEAGDVLELVLSPDPTATLTPCPHVTTHTVTLGGERGARLHLPVLDEAAARR